ncbi:MAG TPA: FAD:protein FMN transferase, partial [Pirellulales bacterium]|nr:FAD:protein FMN transferase [Pirellulales bacterium]
PCLEAAEPQLGRFEFQQIHMGVPVKLVLYSADQPSANQAADAAFERIRQLDLILSDYKPESELSRLSRTSGAGKPTPVSDDLWRVLWPAQQLAERTQGAFDVTVGPYVRLWRRARRSGEFPTSERLAEARRSVGYRHLKLDERRRTAELLAPEMRLDLGGIAAGYAADEALKTLKERGVERALIDISGDLLAGEAPPGRSGWTIGIAPATRADGPPTRHMSLRHAALTTSGDAFQHVVIDGKRYSHIVDPRTGIGLTDQSSVTVIAADCITADSLATAVSVMGPKQGLKLIEETPGAAALVMRNIDGEMEMHASRRLHDFEIESENE